MNRKRIIVVGGGPSGMMAAIRAAEARQDVTLVEKNTTLGKKLILSGKGRCNLTNACDLDSFIIRFPKDGQFLRDAFKKFFNTDLMRFFEKRGLKLKVERQLRVFPVTDKSDSVLKVLKEELLRNNIRLLCGLTLKDILVEHKRVKGIEVNNGRIIPADRVILATGGISYPFTGSTGEGIKIAAKSGHHIIELRPGLVPLEVKQSCVRLLQGLTLKNIRLIFSDGKRQITSDTGELLFTGSGISGPLVLSLSGSIVDWLAEKRNVYVEVDLKPALSRDKLDSRLLREFQSSPRTNIKNAMRNLLPKRLVDVFLDAVGVTTDKKANQVTQEERRRIVTLLKSLRFDIIRSRPIDEAMVTRGGVSLKDINPRTMESRIIKGLYFAGEIIDVDADTGGFNLQAAFSTGYLAGSSASL